MANPMLARAFLTLVLAIPAVPAPVHAQAAAPQVSQIRIEGNRITRDEVILRELALAPGDVLDARSLENSRQSIQDLGLFRDVRIEQEPAPDGGVALIVHVSEKRYLLPIPRIDTSSDLDYTYGAQLRWSNVGGRNHRLVAYVEETRYRSERDRDRSRSFQVRYQAPYLRDTPYGLNLMVDHTEQVTIDRQDNSFEETFNSFEVLATRDFRNTRPRRGWVVGTGLYWHDQKASGEFAPPSDGKATALVATADYSNLRFNVYSDTGRVVNARLETAFKGVGSDFGYEHLEVNYRELRPFGERAHQQLNWHAGAGVHTGGPRSRNTFSLGGSRRMRGYDSDAIEGESYWYVASEYLRPVRWEWLRLLVLAETGSARRNVFGDRNKSLYANIGVGLRARITWFVDIELELGVAMPLIDGGGARFFGSAM